jgi:hypothetical protein
MAARAAEGGVVGRLGVEQAEAHAEVEMDARGVPKAAGEGV